jgi:hypothetical protein
MSFVSCENSAIIHPASYPAGAVGAIIEPTINTVAVASATLLQPIAQFTLPKGRWAITGTLNVVATTGGSTLTGGATGTAIAKDAVVFWRHTNVGAIQDNISVSLSAVVDSDGTALMTLPMTYTTSAGTYGVSASPLSKVQFIRIA